jgi:CYTH domain-containing protein
VKYERIFRIAPSIVRLLLKDRPATTNVEGYLPPRPERTQFVRLEASGCHLLLQKTGGEERSEERTKLPVEQAEALLDASQGRVGYRRTQVRLDSDHVAFLDRFEQPAGLDLVTVEFDDMGRAEDFPLPGWFGPEVSRDGQFRKPNLAISGAPVINEVEVNNAAVIAVIDTLESAPRYPAGLSASASSRSFSAADNPEHTQPTAAHPVLHLPPRVRALPQVPAALDPRVTDVLDGVAKALEGAPMEEAPERTRDEAPAPVEIKRAPSRAIGKVFRR